MVVFIILVIQTNAFLKDKFNSLFTDTFAEMTSSEEAYVTDGINSSIPQNIDNDRFFLYYSAKDSSDRLRRCF